MPKRQTEYQGAGLGWALLGGGAGFTIAYLLSLAGVLMPIWAWFALGIGVGLLVRAFRMSLLKDAEEPPASASPQVPNAGVQWMAQSQQVQTYRKCPFCAEPIMVDAIICRFCGSNLREPTQKAGTTVAIVIEDIKIGNELAFSKDEQVQIEAINPDPNRPEYQYVVLSKSLGKRFRLSNRDISFQ